MRGLCESAYMKYIWDNLILEDASKNAANPSAVFPCSWSNDDGSGSGRGTLTVYSLKGLVLD